MSRQINVVLSLRDRMTRPLERTAGQLREMERLQRRAQNQMNKWATSGVNGLNNLSNKIIKTTGLVAGMATAFAFKTGLSSAMDLEGYRMQLETAMKDTKKAAETMKWAVDFANKTPFETGPIVEATAKLEMYGLASKEYLPLAGDMAASMNKDVMQAVEAIADAQTGELERLKEFGIKKQDIQDKADEMFKKGSTINKKGQIKDAEQFNKALQAIMVEKFAGGMDKQAKTLKGRLSTISGIFKSGLAKIVGVGDDGKAITGSLYDSIGQYVEKVASQFEKWQKDGTIERIQKQVATVFKAIVTNIKKAVDFVKKHPQLVKFILSFALALMVAAKAVLAVKAIMMFFAGLKTVASGIAFLGMGPLGWVMLLVAALVLIVVYWKDIKKWAGIAIDWIVENAPKLWEKIKTGAKDFFDNIVKWGKEKATELWDKMKSAAKGFIDWIIGAFKPVTDAIENTIKSVDNFLNGGSGTDINVQQNGHGNSNGRGNTNERSGRNDIPQNARGTSNWRGGITSIDERGGEIVDLPKGTRIYPHDKSVKMARNEGKQININIIIQNLVGDDALADRVGGIIARKVSLAISNI